MSQGIGGSEDRCVRASMGERIGSSALRPGAFTLVPGQPFEPGPRPQVRWPTVRWQRASSPGRARIHPPGHLARTRREGTVIARIDDLMDKVDSRFHLVHLAAKRAREINGYYAQLGEGMGAFVPPLLTTDTNKPLSIALEEIAQGKIEVAATPVPATDDDGLTVVAAGDQDEPA